MEHVSVAHVAARRWKKAALYVVGHARSFAPLKDSRSRTPIHMAASSFPEAALVILKNPGMALIRDNRGVTPVHLAAKLCSMQVWGIITGSAKFYSLRDAMGRTPLHYGAAGCSDEAMDVLGSSKLRKMADSRGYTVAHYAVRHRIAAVRALDDRGIWSLTDGKGWSVAHEIASCTKDGPVLVVERALKDTRLASFSGPRGITPVHAALDPLAHEGCLAYPPSAAKMRKAADMLGDAFRKALETARTSHIRKSVAPQNRARPVPRKVRRKKGRQRVIKKDRGSSKSSKASRTSTGNKRLTLPKGPWLLRDGRQRTPLHLAAALSPVVASLVIEHTETWHIRDSMGYTPVHYAVRSIENAALKAVRDPRIASLTAAGGVTAAHLAVRAFRSAALKALDYEDIMSLVDSKGITVAHIAVMFHPKAALKALGSRRPAVYLIGAGKGPSVAHYAVRHLEAARLAVKDPKVCRIRDRSGFTVAHWAALFHGPKMSGSDFAPECLGLMTPSGVSVRDLLRPRVLKRGAGAADDDGDDDVTDQ